MVCDNLFTVYLTLTGARAGAIISLLTGRQKGGN